MRKKIFFLFLADEIIYGACVINDNGKGPYSTGLGHGNAMHFSDPDPDNPGLEVFNIQERFGDVGANFHDATTIPAKNRFYTFMHDPVYRLGIAWQNVAYNQPPHTSFYIGDEMDPQPRYPIRLVGK